jgi:hypothetical protein
LNVLKNPTPEPAVDSDASNLFVVNVNFMNEILKQCFLSYLFENFRLKIYKIISFIREFFKLKYFQKIHH